MTPQPQLTDYQLAQLTNQSECYIHTHPRVDNFTFPHGGFSDVLNQTASVNTATAMKLRITDVADGVEVVNDSQILVPAKGVYNVQFSTQFANDDTPAVEISVWFKVSNSNLANSNTMLTVPSKHAGGNGHIVAAWNLFVPMDKGDYIEIMWSTASTHVFIEYTAAQTTPTRPATPSVIATVSWVSD